MDNMLSLDSLAIAINAAHERCQRSYVTMLADARSTGELLLQAKAQVSHGHWTAWLTSNCAFSDRTAQRYMQIANSWDSLQSKTDTVADLGVRMACEMIAQQKVLDKPDETSNIKSASHTAAPRGNLPTTTAHKEARFRGESSPRNSAPVGYPDGNRLKKPDIRPGDRIKVTDEESLEYGQELEVSEVVQDAIALVKKGNESYPLLINQVEVVERPTPPLQSVAESIKPTEMEVFASVDDDRKTSDDLERQRQTTSYLSPPSLPQKSKEHLEPPMAIPIRNTKEITVADLLDLLRRILEECEEYLPQELIDEAKELL